MPVVEKVNAQSQALADLVRLLQEKDSAVSDLIDRVESAGVQLTAAFPTAFANQSNQKLGKKEQIRRSVKGLEVFDVQTFINESRVENQQSDSFVNSFMHASQTSPATDAGSPPSKVQTSDGHVNLIDAQKADSNRLVERLSPHTRGASSKQEIASDDDTTEDDLDPVDSAKLIKASNIGPERDRLSYRSREQQETAEDQPHSEMETASPTTKATSKEKIGSIGKREKSKDLKADGSYVDSDLGEQKIDSLPMYDEHPLKKTTKNRIGVIGGRKSTKQVHDVTATDKPTRDPMEHTPSPRRLSNEGDPPIDRGSQSTPQEEAAAAAKTDAATTLDPQQEADHKRQVLKRELESRGKAQNKKRRKF
ncbi:MAG: hypothetical protein Q9162_001620 [Coniocarpon cinnabarinum]